MNPSPNELTTDRFGKLVQTKFTVATDTNLVVRLELISVTGPEADGTERRDSGSPVFEAFSLVFDGPSGQPLGQGTYRFSHEQLGWFDLFIVPVGAEHGARQYEAVFNRRVG